MWGKIEKGKGSRFKMPSGPGHYFARPLSTYKWGEPYLILFLMNLSTFWHHRSHKFGIGDLADRDPSKPVSGHVSHNGGNAVDLYIIHKLGRERNETVNRVTYHDNYAGPNNTIFKEERYDAPKTQLLANYIGWLALSFPMIEVLYNDPVVQANTPISPRILTDLNKRALKQQQGKSYPNIWQHDDHIHCLLQPNKPLPTYTTDLIKYWVKASGIDALRRFIEDGLGLAGLLNLNARGDAVETLQFVLNLHGRSAHPSLVEDGIFGSKTRQRVVEFQGQRGLSPDGIVGPKTKSVLAQEMTLATLG